MGQFDVLCPHCNKCFVRSLISSHVERCRTQLAIQQRLTEQRQTPTRPFREKPPKRSSTIILYSRRGTRVHEKSKKRCAECRKMRAELHYKESNRGEVYLCSYCAVRVRQRSYGRDGTLAVVLQGGGTETNRRRH
jgi:hypothetical protein